MKASSAFKTYRSRLDMCSTEQPRPCPLNSSTTYEHSSDQDVSYDIPPSFERNDGVSPKELKKLLLVLLKFKLLAIFLWLKGVYRVNILRNGNF